MPILTPMSESAFKQFKADSVVGYAEQNVLSGRWPADGALERSAAEYEKLLPQGLATPDNYIFAVHSADDDGVVGALWLGVVERAGVRMAYVFDILIQEPFRQKGHARRAFKALERFVESLGLATIGLHVFTYNTAARALYESLGYATTSVNMHKQLGPSCN